MMNITKKWKTIMAVTVGSCLICVSAYAAGAEKSSKYNAEPINEVEFYGNPASSIAAGVSVPAGSSYLFTSGTVPPVINKDGKTVYERYGDTKTQGIGILKAIETQLKDKGLTLADVAYLRVYVTPDAAKEGKFDYQGWFDAYAQFFGTKENPVKPARSTVGIAGLVSSDWLIEIEAVAVYPKHHNQD
ncbi:RidA family protein [Paenibacillus qinlingensis]|uniref:Enamine deaminase RidA (YjgF/YER057c/UK114 family) n=1 Tax=Paenibacillus qinlingensis TaxID=1837343 RepID=A0ABU1NVU8_9BACL|nr:RidA family protein [Paenibacillus qinlingensis]MDR6551211.1 enamine deaminase RidA (YjgF/YER057c/UK114 family) [Paenibacillus qinlingensis]